MAALTTTIMAYRIPSSVVVMAMLVAMVTASAQDNLGKSGGGPNSNNVHVMSQTVQGDDGHLGPCEKTDPKFSLTWTPGIIKLGETIHISFSMTPIESLKKGTAELTIWLPEYDDPIYEVSQDFSCGDINKWLPKTCPFVKGKPINIKHALFVKPELPLPGGRFIVKAKITNGDGKLFGCMKGDINIQNASDDYNY